MADFNLAIPTVLRNEGGYVDNPNDSGGATNFGISQRRYPDLDIKNLTVGQAMDIYLRDFWLFGGITDQLFANKIFDMYVNMEHSAIHVVQIILGTNPDGIYGPRTEKAINASFAYPGMLLGYYKAALVMHYRDIVTKNPKDAEFLDGWITRANQ
jgi:lysozyme family protein